MANRSSSRALLTRIERDRMAKLTTLLDRLDAQEKRTLLDIQRAGFRFRSLAQARRFLGEQQEADRVRAAAIERMAKWSAA